MKEKEQTGPPQLKTIDVKTKEFTANGKKYYIMDKISAERYKEYEKLVPVLTFGIGFNEIYSNLMKLWENLNKQNFADSAVICHNIMKGISTIDDPKRVHPAHMMAALVINREGEDVRGYDEQLMKDKIQDWIVEGYDMMSFFGLSLSSIHGFKETLLKYTQENLTILETELKKD